MNKQETDLLKEECINYILNLPIKVNWKRSESIMTWLTSCPVYKPSEEFNKVPNWEEIDGRDCHLIFTFGIDDNNYDSKNQTELNGLLVTIERYSYQSCEWDREMEFIITSLEQFKHIVNGIIKIKS
jgi:hypothetical protein